jgi:hypothetical protein
MGKMRNAYKILVMKHAGKRPFGRLQAYDERKIIKMDLGWQFVDGIGSG